MRRTVLTTKQMKDAPFDALKRGTGKTTAQMKAAPLNAVYVWCNDVLHYPIMLRNDLGRQDLTIVSPRWLLDGRYQGMMLTGLVIDHALPLMEKTYAEAERLEDAIARAMPYVRVRASRVES